MPTDYGSLNWYTGQKCNDSFQTEHCSPSNDVARVLFEKRCKIKIYLTSVKSEHKVKYLLPRLCKLVLNGSSFEKLQIASLYKYIFRSLRKNRHFFDLVMKLTDVRN